MQPNQLSGGWKSLLRKFPARTHLRFWQICGRITPFTIVAFTRNQAPRETHQTHVLPIPLRMEDSPKKKSCRNSRSMFFPESFSSKTRCQVTHLEGMIWTWRQSNIPPTWTHLLLNQRAFFGAERKNDPVIRQWKWATKKNPIAFHYTGCSIGILIILMLYV